MAKIHNWLGQALLEGYADFARAKEHFSISLELADDDYSVGYAHQGLGYVALRSDASKICDNEVHLARTHYESAGDSTIGNIGLIITELLSGELLIATGCSRSGVSRVLHALSDMKRNRFAVAEIDYGIRAARHLHGVGELFCADAVARDVLETAETISLPFRLISQLRSYRCPAIE